MGSSSRFAPGPGLHYSVSSGLATNAVIVGYSRRTGIRSRLAFNAAYAPSEYAFGGSVLGVTTEELDQQVEVEAMWTLSF